jgi:hypothetical protein
MAAKKKTKNKKLAKTVSKPDPAPASSSSIEG